MFSIDLRQRVLDGNKLQILVQFNNNTDLQISGLQGFITVRGYHNEIISEQRLVLIQEYEDALKSGLSVSRGLIFDYNPNESSKYAFHVGRIEFTGDHRIYTYHPKVGLIRID